MKIYLYDCRFRRTVLAAICGIGDFVIQESNMELIGKLRTIPSAKIEKSLVSIGFECLDRELFRPEKCYDLLGASGVKYARVQTGWAKCEVVKGIIDFGWLDDIVDNLLKRGVEPWFNVGFGNPLYMEGIPESNKTAVGCVPLYYGEECVAAWLRFVKALTEHFRDRITHYEIWNESDIRPFWYPHAPDASKLAELITITGRAIREVFPGAKLGTCTSGSWFGYVSTLLEGLTPDLLDFYCMHWYRICAERNYEEQVSHLRRLFRKYGFEGTELWMGEGGYPSWFPKGHWMHPDPANDGSEHQQAVYMLRRMMTDAGLGLKRHSYFQMADMWERPYEKADEVLKKPAAQGILNGVVYTPKESYYAISRLAHVLSGDIEPLEAYFGVDVKDEKAFGRENVSALRHFALKRNGGQMYVWYLPTDIEAERGIVGEMRLDVETFEDVREMREPVVIDLYSGEVFRAEAKIGRGISVDVPIAEYPILLCDRADLEIE